MPSTPQVINQTRARELLAQVDVPQILHKLFRDLAAGQSVQPAPQNASTVRRKQAINASINSPSMSASPSA